MHAEAIFKPTAESTGQRSRRRRGLCGRLLMALACSSFISYSAHVCAQAASTDTASNQIEYRIQPLDTIQITVFQEPDLTQKVKVSQQGTINYPLLGTVQIAGLTVSEAEKRIAALLARDYLVNPRVSIAVENYSGRQVILLGQVKNPGSYEIPADESLTLLQMIARSGGFTEAAASDRVSIVRSENGQKRKIVINVSAIIKNRGKSKDIDLMPGDVVSVPETLF